MKIIYLTDQIHLHGGAEKILIQKLNYWAEVYKYDVTLITTDQKHRKPFFPLSANIEFIDLDINYLSGVSFFNPKNLLKLPKHISKLKKEVNRIKPDAIFVISKSFVRLITPLIARKFKIFNEYHTSYYASELNNKKLSFIQKIKTNTVKSIIQFIENYYTKIIFLNKEEYNYYNLDNAVIIPNFFNETSSNKHIKKKNKIITLGRLCSQKGYDILIDTWKIVDQKIEGWELNIYGNGEDYDKLNQQIIFNKFKNPLNLNPAIDNVDEKLSESAFYVMSSRFETFPMVLLEAMSNGIPIVSFDSPTGARSIITDGEDGILAEPNNINDLAKKILLLIQNKDLRLKMGENAYNNVRKFSPETIMMQWDNLIKDNISN